jgi:hypothetical protein
MYGGSGTWLIGQLQPQQSKTAMEMYALYVTAQWLRVATAVIKSFKLHCHHGNQLSIINYQVST